MCSSLMGVLAFLMTCKKRSEKSEDERKWRGNLDATDCFDGESA